MSVYRTSSSRQSAASRTLPFARPMLRTACYAMVAALLAIAMAFLPVSSAGIAWAAPSADAGFVPIAAAAEQASETGPDGASADGASADGASADGAIADDAAESSEENASAEEAIEDDEVPLAKAASVGRDMQSFVLIGIAVVAAIFALQFVRVGHNMRKMRGRF